MSRGREELSPAVALDEARTAMDGSDEAAFQYLRRVRKNLADASGVPAYIVFSDKVLKEMVARRPTTIPELLAVPGVGPAKLEKYGDAFLGAIAELV